LAVIASHIGLLSTGLIRGLFDFLELVIRNWELASNFRMIDNIPLPSIKAQFQIPNSQFLTHTLYLQRMNKIKSIIEESVAVKNKILADEKMLKNIDSITNVAVVALKKNHRIYFCGNGGSAADAQHLAAEFSGRFYLDRDALPAEALHCNTSYLTAVANDYSFDVIYARLIKGLAHKGDILIGLSTSGNSVNIIKAFETAREKGVVTVGFTGAGGGKMKDLSDYLFDVPSKNTPRIQESHIMIGHIICELVEERYFTPAK
jgi:D-sedoheptulose 7-phosphate isomerase